MKAIGEAGFHILITFTIAVYIIVVMAEKKKITSVIFQIKMPLGQLRIQKENVTFYKPCLFRDFLAPYSVVTFSRFLLQFVRLCYFDFYIVSSNEMNK